MTDDAGSLKAAWAVLRRQWWIVVAAMVAAMAVAWLASADVPDSYVGHATIVVDVGTTKYSGMPIVDDVVRRGSGDVVRSEIASATGQSVADVASALRVTGVGNPQNSIAITYEDVDASIAEKGADAAARAIIGYTHETAAEQVEVGRQQVRASQEALKRLEEQSKQLSPGWEQGDLIYKMWNINGEILRVQNNTNIIENIYAYRGGPSATLKPGKSTRRTNVIGGTAAGLIAGLVIAAAREELLRRASSRQAET